MAEGLEMEKISLLDTLDAPGSGKTIIINTTTPPIQTWSDDSMGFHGYLDIIS